MNGQRRLSGTNVPAPLAQEMAETPHRKLSLAPMRPGDEFDTLGLR